MISLSIIREELKDIKYYYSRREVLEKGFSTTGTNDIVLKLQKYNEAICKAPPKLYDLYIQLYVENHTQESLSALLGFTPEYIQMLNKDLLKFLQAQFEKKENTAC